jgi:hypothetical protein
MKLTGNINQLRTIVIAQIEEELKYCNPSDTPMVCKMISTPNGKKKIVDLILEYVGNAGQSISQAIVSIENETNPKTFLMQ